MKLTTWPDSEAVRHWRAETIASRSHAKCRFSASMAGRMDLQAIYREAIEQVSALTDGDIPAAWSEACPFTVGELMEGDMALLQQRLSLAFSLSLA